MSGLFGGGTNTVNEESKVSSFQINTATYGLPVPEVIGTTRISSNIIDWFNFQQIAHSQTQSAGKGGGGSSTTTITYTYRVAVLLGLCEGPGVSVKRIWKDKEVYANPSAVGLTLFPGNYGQEPWSYALSNYHDRALPYSGLAYLAGVVDCDSSGGLPTFNFEVAGQLLATGDGVDVNPADAIVFITSDPVNGACPGKISFDEESLQRMRDFCKASDLLISIPASEQSDAIEIIKNICTCAHTIAFPSQGKLKFVPKCDSEITANGVTYTPVDKPEYDLGPDDFIPFDDGELIKFSRENSVDAYNEVLIEFLNRENSYEEELARGRVEADIRNRGLRSKSTQTLHYLHKKTRADYLANLQVLEELYARNKYSFRVGWQHCRLEPGDFVTLTDQDEGYYREPVVVLTIEEDEDGMIEVTARQRPPGVYSAARYQNPTASRGSVEYNADPGDVLTPVIFEPMKEIANGNLETWIAVAGANENWGGACVWVSYDGDTYKQIGRITAPARIGKLITALPEGYSKDYQNKLSVKLQGRADLLSGTAADADMKNTLCYVDGEFISYETAILKGVAQYDLYGLRRGAYGSTIKSHAAGSDFVRVDNAIFHYPYRVEDIGRTIFIKFTSYNIFGVSMQELSEVDAYRYTIQGAEQSVPAVSFAVTQDGEKLTASLDRTFLDSNNNSFFSYELRFGTSWDSGVLMGIFSGSRYTFDAPQEGTLTFWLRAVDNKGNASKTAARATVNVVGLPKRNVLFERTDAPDGWTVENMYRVASGYTLQGIKVLGDYEKFFDIFVIPPYLTDSAYIYLPLIDLGENIIESDCYYIDPQGEWHLRSVETLRDYGKFFDIFGAPIHYVTPKYAVQTFATIDVQYDHKQNIRLETEYRVSFDGKVWSDWVTSTQKQFYGRFVAIRIHPVSLDRLTNTVVRSVKVSIDVPDLEDRIVNVDVPTQKTHVAFHRHFTLPPMLGIFAQDLNGKQATWRVSNITETGFDIELLDASGNLIAGKLPLIIARGY